MKRTAMVFAVLLAVAGPARAHRHQKTTVCGKERWAVKTASGPDASRIKGIDHPVAATVDEMRGLKVPAGYDDNAGYRYPPVETTVYRIKARVLGWKFSSDDSDYHIVIADPGGDGSKTMIAEIPCPCCEDKTRSRFKGLIDKARTDFDGRFNPSHRRRTRLQHVDVKATLTGIGFFDRLHGQTGVAPNAVELHPVIGIQFNCLKNPSFRRP